MKFLTVLVLAFTFGAHAQSIPARDQLEGQARKLAIQMRTLVENNVDRMDERDLAQLVRSFEKAKDLLMGRNNPGPVPPTPPVPPAPRYTCDRASAQEYQATFVQVKNFAYSSAGLDLSSTAATSFAQDWATKYSCADAERFISLFARIKNFAYSSSGLDLSSAAAVNYASNGIDRLCEGYAFESEFQNLYSFAYSTSGLDLSSAAAKKYAAERVEPQMFACRPFGL